MTELERLVMLRDAVTAWRAAKCMRPAPYRGFSSAVALHCDGDNHQENCPVELARQDMLAAHNKCVP